MTEPAPRPSLYGGPLVLACSPRRHGNTDTAAALIGDALGGDAARGLIRVADQVIKPCIACGFCDTRPGSCTQKDAALSLLRAMAEAPVACLVSPIYFYHLPAQTKALLDRAQVFWSLPSAYKPGRGRRLGVALLGARPRGDKLFAGAVLSLRYMAEALGMVPAEPLLLYGLEEPDALRGRPDLQAALTAYAQALRSDACS